MSKAKGQQHSTLCSRTVCNSHVEKSHLLVLKISTSYAQQGCGTDRCLMFLELPLLTAPSMAQGLYWEMFKGLFQPKACCDVLERQEGDSTCSSDKGHEERAIMPSTIIQTKKGHTVYSFVSFSMFFTPLCSVISHPRVLWHIHNSPALSDWAQNLTALYGLSWSCKEFLENYY